MKTAIVVPARYASTRYPGKPLIALKGAGGAEKSLIQRSWEAAMAVPGVERVIVATDDDRIAAVARDFGADVAMTPTECRNGTERCAAVVLEGIDLVVNLQGDAPLTPPDFVSALIDAMADDPAILVATPALRAPAALQMRLIADQQAGRVGGTTAALGINGDALYFSKAVIPHIPAARIGDTTLPFYFHIGVYAYRPAALAAYAALPLSPLEQLEGLEQLRFLEHGMPVRVVEVPAPGYELWEVNNPEDVPTVEAALAQSGRE
jgi:3-deoxy-manno-octulosonate cytidylyltransferase (CMP-KDO synthetase)